MRPARARRSCPRPPRQTMNALRTTCIATYAPANSSARSPKASGIATAISRLASITASKSSRTTATSGSNQFVIQVV